jgi:hypothetical protein
MIVRVEVPEPAYIIAPVFILLYIVYGLYESKCQYQYIIAPVFILLYIVYGLLESESEFLYLYIQYHLASYYYI